MTARTILIAYAAGALVALWRTDGRAMTRVMLALLWPLGPLAFVVTIGILVLASPLAFLGKK